MKKKLLFVVLSLIVVFSLGACGKNATPSDTVDSFLKAVKAKDSEKASELYSGKDINFAKDFTKSSSGTASEKEMLKFMEEKILPKMLDFDYEIKDEKIKDDKATVKVKFNAYDMGKAFKNFMTSYMEEAMKMASKNVSDKEISAKAIEIFGKEVDKLKEKSFEKDVTFDLEKKDGKWHVKELKDNEDFLDAFTGGAMSSIGSQFQ